MTGGTAGVAPAAHLAAERRAIVGLAAARILRKGSSPGGAKAAAPIPTGGGSPLPSSVKSKMEPALGADLSSVRIHAGAESAQAASAYGARAFTVGNDIHFNSGELAPGSKEGDKLLAHELTHVVQGQKSGIQRKPEDGGGGEHADEAKEGGVEVSDPSEPAEKEANAVAEKVVEGDEKKAKGDKKSADKANKEGKEEKAEKEEKGDKEKKPQIAAKLESSASAKLYRAPAPGGGPPAPPAGAGPGAAQPDAHAEQKRKAGEYQQRLATLGANLAAPELAALLDNAELKSFISANLTVAEVRALKAEVDRLKDASEDAAEADQRQVTTAVDGIDAKAADADTKLDAAKNHPLRLKWKEHPLWGESGRIPTIYALALPEKISTKKIDIDRETQKRQVAQVGQPNAGGDNANESPQLRELRLRKEYCMKLLEEHRASAIRSYKFIAGVGEIGGLAAKLVALMKPDLGIPVDAIDPAKDAASFFAKAGELQTAAQAMVAKTALESIDSLATMRSIMETMDMLRPEHTKVLAGFRQLESKLLQKAMVIETQGGGAVPTPTPGAQGAAPPPAGDTAQGGLGRRVNQGVKATANALDTTENQDMAAKPAVKAAIDANPQVSMALDFLKSYAAGLELKEAWAEYAKAAEETKKAKEDLDKFLAQGGAAAAAGGTPSGGAGGAPSQ
jgi:hypothetical protein